MANVLIGCKLPNGLTLKHPMFPGEDVTLKGQNSAEIGLNGQRVLIPYGVTSVDEDYWQSWKALHHTDKNPYGPIKSGAIFDAETTDAIKGIAREQKDRKTGLQQMDRDGDERLGSDAKKIKPAKE